MEKRLFYVVFFKFFVECRAVQAEYRGGFLLPFAGYHTVNLWKIMEIFENI